MSLLFPDNTPVENLEGRVKALEDAIQGLNPRNLAGISTRDLRDATRLNIFGNGADGEVTLDGSTDYNNFSSRVSTTYTLTSDVFSTNLTVKSGVTLKTAGFKIFCTGTLTNNGTITCPGGDGGDGVDGSGTAAGGTAGSAAHTSGTLPNTLTGSAGGAGGDGAGTAGSAGLNALKGLGAAGVGGGAGGRGSLTGSNGGSGGNGGSVTAPNSLPLSVLQASSFRDTNVTWGTSATLASSLVGNKIIDDGIVFGYTNGLGAGEALNYTVDGTQVVRIEEDDGSYCFPVKRNSSVETTSTGTFTDTAFFLQCPSGEYDSSAGSGGGGGGGGNNGGGNKGGGGGGSGAPGGFIYLATNTLINNGAISSPGGAGGDGGDGNPADASGGGGGGGGGCGGVVVVLYGTKSGTGTISATGGSAGLKGLKTSGPYTGVDGTDGMAGSSGEVYEIELG